jgi:predicted Zn-dependent protease
MPIKLPPGSASYSEDSSPTSVRQIFALGAALVAIAFLIFLSVFWVLDQLVWWIPVDVEQQIAQLIAMNLPTESSEQEKELNQLLDHLQSALTEDQQRDVHVHYSDDETVNAIALPGNQIIIFQGLLNEVNSENELAMVLGHELGHLINRDHLRSLVRGLGIKMVLATFVGDPGTIQAVAAQAGRVISEAQYSQKQEQKADEFGLNLLYKTYGHAAGATDFFKTLAEKQDPGIIAFLHTHPAPKARVKHLEAIIRQKNYPVKDYDPLPEILQDKFSL